MNDASRGTRVSTTTRRLSLKAIAGTSDRRLVQHIASLVRASGGIRSIVTPELKLEAASLLQDAVTAEARHLLRRIEHGGPAEVADYALYMGVDLLACWTSAEAPLVMATAASRSVAERILVLRRLPEMSQYDGLEKLSSRAERILEHLRPLHFGAIAPRSPDAITIEVGLLPESAFVQDELVFMTVTQACETCFQAAADILAQAEDHVAYADATSATYCLRLARRTLRLLVHAAGALLPLTVERWLAIRPAIVEPSAIQSVAFRALRSHLYNCAPLVGHGRFRSEDEVSVADLRNSLIDSLDALRRWEVLHLGIARKYSGLDRTEPDNPGLTYLRSQIRETEKILEDLQLGKPTARDGGTNHNSISTGSATSPMGE